MKTSDRVVAVYVKYLDRIWNALSKDEKVRLETHFGGIINEIDDICDDSRYNEKEIDENFKRFSIS
tara:strand:+ start:105 stop:302 length:198 start_codon:yes stop_codon:yes gene_type:complete